MKLHLWSYQYSVKIQSACYVAHVKLMLHMHNLLCQYYSVQNWLYLLVVGL